MANQNTFKSYYFHPIYGTLSLLAKPYHINHSIEDAIKAAKECAVDYGAFQLVVVLYKPSDSRIVGVFDIDVDYCKAMSSHII